LTRDEIARRGEEAVRTLRADQNPLARWLLVDKPELLDLDDTPAAVKRRLLDDVERITRVLLLQRYWVHRLGKMILEARRTRRGKPVRILDVGAGGGALLFRVEDWARRRRIPVELLGIDSSAEAVEGAMRRVGEEGRRVELQVGDARAIDLEDGSVDVAVTTLMLHHLPPGDVAAVLAELDRVSAVNFLAFDLRRTLPGVPALWAFLRVGRFDAPTRHDAMVSLRKGYTTVELEALCKAGGIQNCAVTPIPPSFVAVARA
jgi:SAM-dependent methyltransferase